MMEKRIKTAFGISSIILFAFIAIAANAEVFKWVDSQGNVHFSDKKNALQQARSVQLKSTISTYDGKSLPEYKGDRPIRKKSPAKGNKRLPRLAPKRVIMYSTTWCGYCKKAKAYFRKKGIAYSERDIEKSPQANKEYKSYGGDGVPLILVGNKNGTRRLSGFSIARFDAAYK